MKIMDHQGFGEWVLIFFDGVYLPHLHKTFNNVLSKKMVAKCHGFIVQGATRISRAKRHTNVVHKYRYRFGYLDPHWYKVVSEHNIPLERLLQRCALITKCWCLHGGLEFLWRCCGFWSHHWKQPGGQSPSDLVVPMVGIHKHINFQFIKLRFSKILIHLLTKVWILMSKIILRLNLLIIDINGQCCGWFAYPIFGYLFK